MVQLAHDYNEAGLKLYEKLHLSNFPVAFKYLLKGEKIGSAFTKPSNLKQKWSICQAITYARRWGWSVAMTQEDNFCVPSLFVHRWVDITREEFLASQMLQKWHKDEAAEKRRIDRTIAMMGIARYERLKQYGGMLFAPLHHADFVPDSIAVFGNAENITHIIHALTYNGENYPISTFEGFGETCVKGSLAPFITGIPQIVIPGMGDRGFSGVYDYEIAIGLPAKMVFGIVENLFATGGPLNMGQPVKTLIANNLTESITPGFQYLRKIVDEK
jgi:uncharacterized protein (DUF169 family)